VDETDISNVQKTGRITRLKGQTWVGATICWEYPYNSSFFKPICSVIELTPDLVLSVNEGST
jgi:hypothetical protein